MRWGCVCGFSRLGFAVGVIFVVLVAVVLTVRGKFSGCIEGGEKGGFLVLKLDISAWVSLISCN